ncbi:hypothetical protein ADL21_11110 [Streptomyces albus subsp. albus]|nr:hypothetical protein ADL21_11110 [Streptomyces albus subsp. albus]
MEHIGAGRFRHGRAALGRGLAERADDQVVLGTPSALPDPVMRGDRTRQRPRRPAGLPGDGVGDGCDEFPEPVRDESQPLDGGGPLGQRRAGPSRRRRAVLRQLLIGRQGGDEVGVPREVVDEGEEEPPAAGAPQCGQVPAPQRQVRFDRLAVPAQQMDEARASPKP